MDAQLLSDIRRYQDGREAAEREWEQAYEDHIADVRYGLARADVNYQLTGRGMRGPETWELYELLQEEADMAGLMAEPWRLLMLAANGELKPSAARKFLDDLASAWAARQAYRSSEHGA